MSEPCARIDCPNEGTAWPILLLYPWAGYKKPAQAELGILVCSTHQAESKAVDFISDEGWPMIAAAFTTTDRAAPRRELTGLMWRPISAPGPFRRMRGDS